MISIIKIIPSYLYDGNPNTWEIRSLYWNRARVIFINCHPCFKDVFIIWRLGHMYRPHASERLKICLLDHKTSWTEQMGNVHITQHISCIYIPWIVYNLQTNSHRVSLKRPKWVVVLCNHSHVSWRNHTCIYVIRYVTNSGPCNSSHIMTSPKYHDFT